MSGSSKENYCKVGYLFGNEVMNPNVGQPTFLVILMTSKQVFYKLSVVTLPQQPALSSSSSDRCCSFRSKCKLAYYCCDNFKILAYLCQDFWWPSQTFIIKRPENAVFCCLLVLLCSGFFHISRIRF